MAVPEGPEGDRLLARLQPGQWVTGQVRGRAEFGVFVDIGGGTALVPISGGGGRRWKPADGSIVTTEVVHIDRPSRRVTLSRRSVDEAFRGAMQMKGKARRTRTGWQIVASDGAAFSAFVADRPATSLDEVRLWHVSQLEIDGARPVRPVDGSGVTGKGRTSMSSKKKRRGARKAQTPAVGSVPARPVVPRPSPSRVEEPGTASVSRLRAGVPPRTQSTVEARARKVHKPIPTGTEVVGWWHGGE